MLVVVRDRVLVVLDHPRLVDPRVLHLFDFDALLLLVDQKPIVFLGLKFRALLVRGEPHIGPNPPGDAALLVLAQDRRRRAGALLPLLALLLLALLLLALDYA